MNVLAQESRGVQIYLPAEQFRQLPLNGKETKAHRSSGFKLDEYAVLAHASVAVRATAWLDDALHHPAVHIYGLAGDKLGLVRCQECHHVGYVLGITMVSEGDVLAGVPFDCLLA